MTASSSQVSKLTAFIYTIKAALAGVLALLLAWIVSDAAVNGAWAAVSAVIVIQPYLHTSLQASIVRVKANFIAAVIGGALHSIIGIPLVDMFLGILAVGMVCHHFKLDEGLRAAYAGVTIITLTLQGDSSWSGSLHRVIAVMLGCLCALLVNVLFDHYSLKFTEKFSRHFGGAPGDSAE
ncbi:MAG TPA: aromatic acid exporter family protein [Opitutales bacterium]|nr:aromatic acid exporter family protein [Opitutales bacterium]